METAVISPGKLSVYSNRKAEWNRDCQGETFLGGTQAALLFLTDRPGFGASLRLKNYFWGKKVVSWCGYDILLWEAPAPDIIWYHRMEETQWEDWTSEQVSVPLPAPRVTTSSPKFLTLFFPPHLVSLTSLGSLYRLMLWLTPLRRTLQYHTHACNSPRGHFHLDVLPPPSRFLHLKLNPFIFIIKVASAPNPRFCLRYHFLDLQAARLDSLKLSLTYSSPSSTSTRVCFQMSLKFPPFPPFLLFRCSYCIPGCPQQPSRNFLFLIILCPIKVPKCPLGLTLPLLRTPQILLPRYKSPCLVSILCPF